MKNKLHPSHWIIRNRWFRLAASLLFAFMLFLIPVTLGVVVQIPSPALTPHLAQKITNIELTSSFGAASVQAAGGITVTKTTALTVTPGGILTYTLVVTNGTGGDLTPFDGIAVYDFTPNEITCFSTQGPSGWSSSCPNAAPNADVTWALASGTFAKDAMIVLTFTAQVSTSLAHKAEIVNDNYGASGHALGPPFTTTIIAPVWGITKTVDKSMAQPNDVLQYTITVSNVGFANTSGPYTITDEIPANTSIESAGGGTLNGNMLTWTFSDPLAASGGSKNVVYTVRITSPITNGVKIVNDGYTVAGGNASAAAVNDPVTTTVNAQANLSISKIVAPGSVTVGDTLTYTLIVTNNTATTYAEDVLITDTLSTYVTYQSAGFLNGLTGNITATGGNLIIWSLDNPLGPTDSARVTVTVLVSNTLPNPAQITNNFKASAGNASPVSGLINTPVQPAAPSAINVVVASSPISVCATTVATATVRDSFNNPVSGVSVDMFEVVFGTPHVTPTLSTGVTGDPGTFATTFQGTQAGSNVEIRAWLSSNHSIRDETTFNITSPSIPTKLQLKPLPPTILTAGGNTAVITGTLTDCTGAKIENQTINLTLSDTTLATSNKSSDVTNTSGQITATLTSTATTTASGTVAVTGTASGSGWSLQDVITLTIQPVAVPVLTLAKTADPVHNSTVNPEGTINYTIRVTNSVAVANNVRLTDTLPVSVGVVGIISSTNGSGVLTCVACPGMGNTVVISASELGINQFLEATIQVTVTETISGVQLGNRAYVSSNMAPVTSSNIVTHTVITTTSSNNKVYLPVIIKES